MTAALEGGEWSAAHPGRTLPTGKTRYPFYRRLGGPQGRSGRAENLVPTGIRSRTAQPVAQSLYRLGYPAHNLEFLKWLNKPGNIGRYNRKRDALRHLEKLSVCASQLQMYRDPAYRHVLQLRWPKPLAVLVNY